MIRLGRTTVFGDRYEASVTKPSRPLRGRLQLPEHVHDDPPAVVLGQVQVIDPVRGDDLDARGILELVQDQDVPRATIRSVDLAPAGAGRLEKSQGAHLVEPALLRLRVGADHPRGELRVKGALHPPRVTFVPALDV